MLILERQRRLPHGWLVLRIYAQRSFLRVLPDAVGEIGFKRDYDWAERDLAERDFEQLARACGASEATERARSA